jgi:hypothetical protein
MREATATSRGDRCPWNVVPVECPPFPEIHGEGERCLGTARAMEQAQTNWIANFIWGIADDVLRDLYVRGKYRDVILPMIVLRRLDAVLEPTKKSVLNMKTSLDAEQIANQEQPLRTCEKRLDRRPEALSQDEGLRPAVAGVSTLVVGGAQVTKRACTRHRAESSRSTAALGCAGKSGNPRRARTPVGCRRDAYTTPSGCIQSPH